MELQGRDLSEGVRGSDVALLHTELTQLREAGLLDADKETKQFINAKVNARDRQATCWPFKTYRDRGSFACWSRFADLSMTSGASS